MTGLKGSKKNVLEKIEVDTKAIKEEKQSDESNSLSGNESSDSLIDEIGESGEEEESESLATKSNITSSNMSSGAITSTTGGTMKSGIGALQKNYKKFTGSSLGYNRNADPSVLAWGGRMEPSRLEQQQLDGIDGNKEEILKLIDEKLLN